jgi:ABC-2 type transport system ATP-binding protein
LCDRIVIIDHGKVIADDSLAGLYRQLPISASLEIELEGVVNIPLLLSEAGVKTASQQNGRLSVGVDSLTASATTVLAWLATHGHQVNRISSGRANLETLFLSLTGRQLRDA